MEKVIYKWIENLIKGGKLPLHLIDENFNIEDGMTLQEYWDYEQANFAQYANGCRLNEGFTVSIVDVQQLSENKKIAIIYVKNIDGKIVFKMNITVLNDNKISSNDFQSHMVPKYVIEDNQIKKLGVAIKTNVELENIISTELEKISFEKSSSFEEDGFYIAQFMADEDVQNRSFTFHLKFAGTNKKEKRTIFFDQMDFSNCPYTLGEWTILTKNTAFPVNFAVYYQNGKMRNVAYPKDEIAAFIGVKKIIVTDSLDNDWIVKPR